MTVETQNRYFIQLKMTAEEAATLKWRIRWHALEIPPIRTDLAHKSPRTHQVCFILKELKNLKKRDKVKEWSSLNSTALSFFPLIEPTPNAQTPAFDSIPWIHSGVVFYHPKLRRGVSDRSGRRALRTQLRYFDQVKASFGFKWTFCFWFNQSFTRVEILLRESRFPEKQAKLPASWYNTFAFLLHSC